MEACVYSEWLSGSAGSVRLIEWRQTGVLRRTTIPLDMPSVLDASCRCRHQFGSPPCIHSMPRGATRALASGPAPPELRNKAKPHLLERGHRLFIFKREARRPSGRKLEIRCLAILVLRSPSSEKS